MKRATEFAKNLYQSYGSDHIYCKNGDAEKLAVYIVVDGHSQREGSGDLASRFIEYIQENVHIIQSIEFDEIKIKDLVIELLQNFQKRSRLEFVRSAMSMMIVIACPCFLYTFFIGDCRLGIINKGKVSWLNRPHIGILQQNPNMSENELRENEYNHIVYKQFLAKVFNKPDYQKIPIEYGEYIVCSDGFWKLPLTQQDLLLSEEEAAIDFVDDIAYITFKT